jgi:hypothetical protein
MTGLRISLPTRRPPRQPLRHLKKERTVIRMTLSAAFLATPLVKAALEGRLPRGFGVRRLTDLPMDWAQQSTKLGLEPHSAP